MFIDILTCFWIFICGGLFIAFFLYAILSSSEGIFVIAVILFIYALILSLNHVF
jgi:hypothetical protein